MIEIKRAVFLEPRVVVDLLQMEAREVSETPSKQDQSESCGNPIRMGKIELSLKELSLLSDNEEEPTGCKVILEDVYLESVSLPRSSLYIAESWHRSGVRACACAISWRK